MKISVSYDERTYGNSEHSTASEITISGDENIVNVKVGYKTPQSGRSWDWASAGNVGGARIEMKLEDAKALASALASYIEALEKAGEKSSAIVNLRLRENCKPEFTVWSQTYEQRMSKIKNRLQKIKRK